MAKKEAENKEIVGTGPAKAAPKKAATPSEAPKALKAPAEEQKEAKKAAAAPRKAVEEAPERARPQRSTVEDAPKKVAAKPAGAHAPLAHGVGRRKSAIARVWLRRGKGKLTVNQKEHVHYFDTELSRAAASLPFRVYAQASHYDVTVNVSGGGLPAQADAVKLGIARALLDVNPEIRPLLREHGLLTVDSRVKERKKYGQKAARRKFQFVKR